MVGKTEENYVMQAGMPGDLAETTELFWCSEICMPRRHKDAIKRIKKEKTARHVER